MSILRQYTTRTLAGGRWGLRDADPFDFYPNPFGLRRHLHATPPLSSVVRHAVPSYNRGGGGGGGEKSKGSGYWAWEKGPHDIIRTSCHDQGTKQANSDKLNWKHV